MWPGVQNSAQAQTPPGQTQVCDSTAMLIK